MDYEVVTKSSIHVFLNRIKSLGKNALELLRYFCCCRCFGVAKYLIIQYLIERTGSPSLSSP